MREKKEKARRAASNATTRLSSEEVNRRAKNKKVDDMSKTQVLKDDIAGVSSKKSTKNKKGKKKKLKFGQKHPRIATIIKIFLLLILLFIIICAGIFFGALWGGFNFFDLLSDEYKIDLEALVVGNENSYIYDADGNELGSLSEGAKRISLTLNDMGKYLPKAYVAIEDERFYEHSGVDFKRTAAATLTYLTHKGNSSFGGSTITQQVVKNITQDKEDTAERKVKEMVKALQVEHILSKDQILELYLNLIFVGGKDVNGVGLGAVYYFNKDVQDLSLAECAYMAAINNSPNMYDPFKEDDGKEARIEKGEKRAKVVLGKMKELGYIKDKEYKEAIAEVDAGLHFENGNTNVTTLVSYQVDAAIDEIVKQLAQQDNISEDAAKVKLYSKGYKIYVSQRTSIQNEIEEEMSNWDRYHVVSGDDKDGKPGQDSMSAMAIVDPKTGEIVACGAGIGQDKVKTYLGYYNYCTDMLKQTGSTMKPLAVLSAGLENGKLTAASTFYDGATSFSGVLNANGTKKVYKDEGAYRNTYMTLRDAIAYSQNIPNLKAISYAGTTNAAQFVRSVGITDANDDIGVGLALGALPNGASTVQMAAAYAAISNGGTYIEPTFYQKVTDKKGNIVLQPKSVEERSTRVMSEQNAYIVKNVMQGTVNYGTAASYGKIPNQDTSAKTGTTNNDYDRWYVTFTNYYAAACWYGYEYNAAVHWDGPNPAGAICSNVMKDVHNGLEASSFTEPGGLVRKTVCKYSGMAAGPGCSDVYEEVFVKGTEPAVCDKHMMVKLCVETGLLASEYCQVTVDAVRYLKPDTEAAGKWETTYVNTFEMPTDVCHHTAASYTYED
ncbi:MAG: penicillin-binding protein [Clostridia bacterium]|nr:penicillin-binding protein [Clostridia bacterium]